MLNVQGLTCVSCENKLHRSLSIVPSVQNLRTSLILCQAEFDLDLSIISVDDVIRAVKRTSGFICERLAQKGQDLDIEVVGDTVHFLKQNFPAGVITSVLLDKQTIRIMYDANIIGARDLLKTIFNLPVQLAPIKSQASLAAGNRHVLNVGLMTLFSAVLTVPVLVLAWAPVPKRETTYASISLALATIVQIVVAGPFYPSAIKALIFTHVIEMELLIVLITTAAYVFSVVSFIYQLMGHPLTTGEFFQTSTLLITFIMLGRFVSALARQKAVESISIKSLQTTTALLMDSDGKTSGAIDTRLLQYGDIFKVVPDSCIPTDGIVIAGMSEVNESMMTGELRPIQKLPGSIVLAGSVNGSGSLVIRLTRLPGQNTISKIADMVDEAKFSKPRTQELADRVAQLFVLIIVSLTVVTLVVWISVGIVLRQEAGSTATVQAITYAISVLIISCPCALGLAVPMVVVIAGGVAAKRGVVFKSGQVIEIARKVVHVVFDKTGTLTQGKLAVIAEEYFLESQVSTRSAILGLTSDVKHPVSLAISRHLRAIGVLPADVKNVKTVTSQGVEGIWNDSIIRAGNSRWLGLEESPLVQLFLSKNLTVFCVVSRGTILAIFGLKDSLCPDAVSVISELHQRGITVSIVSGDDRGAVESAASQLGLPASQVKSRCTPANKQQYIKDIMGNEGNIVFFCGDGTNDAVALAQASIGVHVNKGTDVAQSAADAVLLRPFLSGVLVLIDLSQASYRRILFNFVWCFFYNLVAILLAAGAFVHARIPPQYAGLGEIVSVLPVILIALQLKWTKLS